MADSAHLEAVVTFRTDAGPNLWIVRLHPEECVSFQPGQYLTLGVPSGNRILERPYSVASAPGGGELEFFVELVHEGELTPRLYDVPVGGRVFLRRIPKGRLLFDAQSGRSNHFMVATVTGVAPFLSMIRDLAAEGESGRPYQIVLLHAASTPSEFGYLDELSGYDRKLSWFRYVPTISRMWCNPEWNGETGRVEDVLRKHLDRHGFIAANTTAYLCGNPNMIFNAKAILQRVCFPAESIWEERYWRPEASPLSVG
ncbi:MAG: FAD-binding oxidoreductase [Bryobacteraceae bacterium]